jgi:thiol-disulfide isomerase/thioredoxin
MKGFFKSKIAKIIYAAIGLAVVGVFAFALYVNMALVDVGETAQDWTLKSPDGDSVVFYEVSGDKPSVLIFWATWCGYCQELMPELAEFEATLPPGTANFYALNVFEDGDPVAYFADHGYEFELLLEADEIAEKYGVFGTPGLIVVDVNNTVIYARQGADSLSATAENLREVLLN